MENKTEQEGTKVVLNALHFDAIAMRYQGLKYKEIKDQLFEKHGKYILEGRLRKWFMEGGILHQLYKDYSKQETEERKELMHQQLRKLGMRIPEVLEETLFMPMRNPFTGEIIKDTNGETVYVRGKVTTEAIKVLAQLLGAKFADDEAKEVGDVLDVYFDRLAQATLPAAPAVAAPAAQPVPAAAEAPKT